MVNIFKKSLLREQKKVYVFLGIIIFFSCNFLHALNINNFEYIYLRNVKSIRPKVDSSSTASNIPTTSETKYLGMALIKFYQLYISTQDKPSCNFNLSCSHFGMEAIKNRGFFIGTLLTADRLTRCNTLTLNNYKIDLITRKAIDNVPFYEFH